MLLAFCAFQPLRDKCGWPRAILGSWQTSSPYAPGMSGFGGRLCDHCPPAASLTAIQPPLSLSPWASCTCQGFLERNFPFGSVPSLGLCIPSLPRDPVCVKEVPVHLCIQILMESLLHPQAGAGYSVMQVVDTASGLRNRQSWGGWGAGGWEQTKQVQRKKEVSKTHVECCEQHDEVLWSRAREDWLTGTVQPWPSGRGFATHSINIGTILHQNPGIMHIYI